MTDTPEEENTFRPGAGVSGVRVSPDAALAPAQGPGDEVAAVLLHHDGRAAEMLAQPGAALTRRYAGRRRERAWLAETLDTHGRAVITEVPSADGQGGLGKTALAWAHAADPAADSASVSASTSGSARYPGGVLRLSLANTDADAVAGELAAWGVRLGLDLGPDMGLAGDGSLRARLEELDAALAAGPRRLLILDDCPDARTFQTWAPVTPHLAVIATARRAPWAGALGLPELPLQTFDIADGLDLLYRHRPDLTPADPGLGRVVEALGRVPEALALAGHTLAYRRAANTGDPSPDAYLQGVQAVNPAAQRLDLGRGPRPPAGREGAVARAVVQAVSQLHPSHGPDILARAVLHLLCAFRPDAEVPAWLLRRCAALCEGPPDDGQVAAALDRLVALGLVRRPGPGGPLTVSRLVAAWTVASDPPRQDAAHRLCTAACARAAQAAAREGRVNDLLRWQHQVRHLADAAEARRSPHAGLLLGALAGLMVQLDEPEEGGWLAERAAAVHAVGGGPHVLVPTPEPRRPAEVARRPRRSEAEEHRLDTRIRGIRDTGPPPKGRTR